MAGGHHSTRNCTKKGRSIRKGVDNMRICTKGMHCQEGRGPLVQRIQFILYNLTATNIEHTRGREIPNPNPQGTGSKISSHTKQQNGTQRSKINQSSMIFKNARNNRNSRPDTKKAITNVLHIFKKVEKNYKRESGRKDLHRNSGSEECRICSVNHLGCNYFTLDTMKGKISELAGRPNEHYVKLHRQETKSTQTCPELPLGEQKSTYMCVLQKEEGQASHKHDRKQ